MTASRQDLVEVHSYSGIYKRARFQCSTPISGTFNLKNSVYFIWKRKCLLNSPLPDDKKLIISECTKTALDEIHGLVKHLDLLRNGNYTISPSDLIYLTFKTKDKLPWNNKNDIMISVEITGLEVNFTCKQYTILGNVISIICK